MFITCSEYTAVPLIPQHPVHHWEISRPSSSYPLPHPLLWSAAVSYHWPYFPACRKGIRHPFPLRVCCCIAISRKAGNLAHHLPLPCHQACHISEISLPYLFHNPVSPGCQTFYLPRAPFRHMLPIPSRVCRYSC